MNLTFFFFLEKYNNPLEASKNDIALQTYKKTDTPLHYNFFLIIKINIIV